MNRGRCVVCVLIFAYFVVGVVLSPLFFVLALLVAIGRVAEWIGDQIVEVFEELKTCWNDWK